MKPEENTIVVHPKGILTYQGTEYRCALGKNGVTDHKVEGDNCTPVGCFPIRRVFYRADKLGPQTFPLETHVIEKNDAWCDDSHDERYNTWIKRPADDGEEQLWRKDDVYDVVVILGYNDDPPVSGKGSAIFMHVAREGYTPTAGCIALSLEDLIALLSRVTVDTAVCIESE